MANNSVHLEEIKRIETECSKKIDSLRTEIRRAEEEKQVCLSRISEVTESNPFSQAVKEVAKREQYSTSQKHIGLPKRLQGWTIQYFWKDPNSHQNLNQEEKYDVAISFAEENRHIAKAIFTDLRANGIKVFYDESEKYILWGKNTLEYFTEVYFSKSKFCMPLISTYYVQRIWKKLERQAMQAHDLFSKTEVVLPVRLDDTDVPGLLPTVGYLDYRKEGVAGIVEGVIAKLKLSQEK